MINFLYKIILTSILILGSYSCDTGKNDESDHAINISDTSDKTIVDISIDNVDSTSTSSFSDNQSDPTQYKIKSISEIY